MANLKIRIYITGKPEPQTTITIPVRIFKLGARFLPKSIAAILDAEGIDLQEILALSENQEVHGTLVEIEEGDQKIVLSLER